MSQRFAVIGNPITHSLSPLIHQHFAEQTHISLVYEKITGKEQQFEHQVSDFFTHGGKGLNVTLPFKQKAFAMAQESTPRCSLASAANTLWVQGGRLCADNTDGIGLIRDLTRHIELPGKNILILGAGGAARGIMHPLLAIEPESLTIVNRTVEKALELKGDFPKIRCYGLDNIPGVYDLIINATSASLDGNTVSLPLQIMSQKPFCYDLAYNRKQDTTFVSYAKSYGCEALDGIGMLIEQAAEAFFIWNKVLPETQQIFKLLKENPSRDR